MPGICSRHIEKTIGCRLCDSTPSDVLTNFDQKLQEAQNAGLHKCSCGFTFYLTVNHCPRCNKKNKSK